MNTEFGLVGKNNIPTRTNGRLGRSTIPLIKEAKIYITNAAEPND